MKTTQIDKLILVVLLIWIVGIFSAPLITIFPEAVGFLILWKHTYSFVCHQEPGKCYYVADYSLSVCARCLGIYVGSLLGFLLVVLMPYLNKKLHSVPLIILALIMMSLDVFFVLIELYSYDKMRATFTGAIVGIILISYIYPEIRKFFIEKKNDDS